MTVSIKKKLLFYAVAVFMVGSVAMGADADKGEEFKAVYEFVYNAANGYLGRSLAITGGLIGLLTGAITGRLLLGASGIGVAIFGMLGPKIVNTIFAGAVI